MLTEVSVDGCRNVTLRPVYLRRIVGEQALPGPVLCLDVLDEGDDECEEAPQTEQNHDDDLVACQELIEAEDSQEQCDDKQQHVDDVRVERHPWVSSVQREHADVCNDHPCKNEKQDHETAEGTEHVKLLDSRSNALVFMIAHYALFVNNYPCSLVDMQGYY